MYLRLSPYLDVLQGVIASLDINEGIIKITGKSGAGKTALCTQLVSELQSRGQPFVFFLQAPASVFALQNEILERLDLDSSGNFTRTLSAYLLARSAEQKPLVLIFDDAQQLEPQTFSAIRMLCNIQDRSRSLVRVVLCGTEELDEVLASPTLRAVTQFLSQSFTLPYLTQDQVNDFCLAYWMAVQEDMKPMSERTLEKLFQETRGHPGILQARLNQGTTGAEKSERSRDRETEAPAPAKPYRYAGRRAGWVPGLLIIAGLLLLGGAGAYLFLQAPASPPVVADAVVPPLPAPEPEALPAAAEPTLVIADTPALPAPETSSEVAASSLTPEETDEETDVAPEENAVAQPLAVAVEDLAPLPAVAAAAGPSPPVEDLIAAWTTSWQEQDIDAYLAWYHPEFISPQGLALEAWREQRQRIIANARDIVISVENPEFSAATDDGMHLVRFWLHYRAANYADRTLKELLLAPVDGTWRIRAENNLRTERD